MSYFKEYPSCSTCKHADLYIPYWSYPHLSPRCEITGKEIEPDDCCSYYKRMVFNEFPCGKCAKDCGHNDDAVINDCEDFISNDIYEFRKQVI